MRRSVAVLCVLAALLASQTVTAAPTCLNRAGDGVRCGVPGAMPVGWSPPPEQVAARLAAMPPGPDLGHMMVMIYVVGAIFAIIALMPEFDGRNPEDWDEQEGDR